MIEYGSDAKSPSESWTWTLKKPDQPTPVGDPLIAPVEAFSVTPAGRAPLATLHV
jgi:hypothetical protein